MRVSYIITVASLALSPAAATNHKQQRGLGGDLTSIAGSAASQAGGDITSAAGSLTSSVGSSVTASLSSEGTSALSSLSAKASNVAGSALSSYAPGLANSTGKPPANPTGAAPTQRAMAGAGAVVGAGMAALAFL